MALWSNCSSIQLLGLLSFHLLLVVHSAIGIRVGIVRKPYPDMPVFREAPAFANSESCGATKKDKIHISMTLDANYLRGTMGAVLSILQHSTCPENFVFHFLSARFEPEIYSSIKSTFPYLNWQEGKGSMVKPAFETIVKATCSSATKKSTIS